MQLKSLEIQGFKSFPDKTKLQFHQGLTAVVGPNGSGKSNISDAVRWVLGEQSTRTLRGERMEDVIFSGTKTRKPQGFASVKLTIDNRERDLPVEADEVEIARKLYRSGESEYRLNGAAVRLRDIHELFMDTGLGRDGYSMIGQGKIAEIVGAKSTQRREIFEEAAGISKYRYRKSEALKRLEGAQDNFLRVRDIFDEIEARVGPLKTQSEKAQEFLRLSERKKALEIALWLQNLDGVNRRLSEQQDKLLIAQSEYDRMQQSVTEAEEKIASFYQKLQQNSAQSEEVRVRIREKEALGAAAQEKSAVLQNDLYHSGQQAERLREEMQSGTNSYEKLHELSQQYKEELLKLRDEREQKQQTLQTLLVEHDRIAAQEKVLQQHQLELGTRLEQLTGLENSLRVDEAATSSRLEETKQRAAVLTGSFSTIDETLAGLQKEEETVRELLAALEETLLSLKNTQNGYRLKKDAVEKKYELLLEEKRKLQTRYSECEQRARLLEDMQRRLEGFHQSVRQVIQASRRGELKGVLGTVSDILSVEERYATAVETALGSSIQHIVVEDEATAKRSIEFLKRTNTGRATFLPVTSVRGNRLTFKGLEECGGFVALGCDLVRVEKRYEPIALSLLGRIAVVEDLNDAIAISKKFGYAFRIVTLDGQMVNAGGSFTGGSAVRSSNILSRKNEAEELTHQAQQLQKQLDTFAEREQGFTQELSFLAASLEAVAAEERTAQEDKIGAQAEQKRVALALQSTRELKKRSEKDFEELQKRLSLFQEQSAGAQQKLEELAEQLAAVRGELDVAAGEKTVLEEQKAGCIEQLSQQRLTLLGLEKDLQARQQSAEELCRQQEDRQEHMESLKQQLLQQQQNDERLREEILQLTEQGKALERERTALDEELTALSARRLELEAQSTALRTEERQLSQEKERFSGELARLSERKVSLQAEYDGIIARLWDEYELTRSQAQQCAATIEEKSRAQAELAKLKNSIRALGAVNLSAIEEYKEVAQRHAFLKEQLEDVTNSKNEIERLIRDLTAKMKNAFSESFEQINKNFQEVFVELFGGGRAQLKLTDPEDILESGIEIVVEPPGKVIKNLSLLSGGEQAFVAIALYFAILKVRPAPFCLLDEIEAALDDVNVTRYAQYLRTLSDETQFIMITHRRGTMENADILYGVTMQEEGVSRLLELPLSQLESGVQQMVEAN